jgi:anti-sigma factor RsiW
MIDATQPHAPGDCRAMFRQLSEYLDNELDDVTCEHIRRHADACIPCKACMETLRRTVDFCKNSVSRPVPEGFSERLKTVVQQLVESG